MVAPGTAARPTPGPLRAGNLGARAAALLRDNPAFPFAAIAVGVFIWFAADEGGFEGTTFLPATLLLLALLATCLVALPRPRPGRLVLAAAALLVAYAAWSYLSISWAEEQGLAWDGANRTLLYAIVFALFALWPMRPGPAAALAAAFGIGVAVVGLVELVRADGAARWIQYFYEGRLSEPAGYVNANVELWFAAFWPCAILAGRREVPSLLRGLCLGSAGLLAALTVLGQSRAWLFLLPVVVVLAVVLVPGRGRTIVTLAVLGGAIAIMLPSLLDVFDAFQPRRPTGPALSHALSVTLIVSGTLFALGLLAGLVDRRLRLGEGAARRISAVVVAVFVLACAGGLIGFSAAVGSPTREIADKWRQLKHGGSAPQFRGSRFSLTVTQYRYDYWRVAWDLFREHPFKGIGVDNFGRDYLVRGRSDQTPTYPHSVEMRTLAQTGLVGALLLLGAVAAALAAAFPALRRGTALAGGAAGAALFVFVDFAVHGSVDWLWEFAGLGAPAFAMLGLAAAVASAHATGARAALPGGRALAGAAALVALVAAAGIVLPWLSERDLRDARAIAASNPSAAIERLDRAASLNPLSPLPDATAAVIELRRGQLAQARRHLQEALRRDPRDSYSYLQLGAIASVSGRRGEALRLVGRAHRLAPKDAVASAALHALRSDRRLSPERLNRLALRDIDERIGPE